MVHCQLRDGKQHDQGSTPEFLDEAIGYAERITRAKLLVWLDAGNNDLENIQVCRKHKADWIITQNLREESAENWLEERGPKETATSGLKARKCAWERRGRNVTASRIV